MLLSIDERESKITGNTVFDCHLLPIGRQMAVKSSVSNDFLSMFFNSINILIAAYPLYIQSSLNERSSANRLNFQIEIRFIIVLFLYS